MHKNKYLDIKMYLQDTYRVTNVYKTNSFIIFLKDIFNDFINC